ncbi:hypothetical protein FQN57_005804 [Myotisia sp. PD_48]|nr:hypothetical protein FQN57_005804 [Myotisia sp. PD_48]
MSQPLPNRWHHRRVAETSPKSCMICHKPSTSVLITPDNKDFFYICPAHLKDTSFCTPIINEEEIAAKKKKEELDREIEKVKQEYEEKQRRKKEKKKEKEQSKDKKDEEASKAEEEDERKKDEKEKDDKIKALQKPTSPTGDEDDSPRIFSLHRNFYNMRRERLRQIEIAKRNQQRLQNPSLFPATPNSDL